MGNRDEVKAFLSTRRAKLTPEQAGLAHYSRNRRVPGLRRSEVADLAGVSVEYYAQLERGNLSGVSESVLEALARALQLDEAERVHLGDLARAAGPAARARRKPRAQQVRPSLARVLAGMTGVPAIVNSGTLDLLAANALGRALFAPVFAAPARPVNHARFCFLDPGARDFWIDWERAADDTVAALRLEAGRNPYDKGLTDLVGELSTHSDAFRARWAAHDVRLHRTGIKVLPPPRRR
ncbi:helix-turn-helix transcriptional regulator [Blastococcus sp. CT_GayMR19]|uniref:helix-turn-helix domain-containing protein n=1 Tax=Blastococcus sp. CT_GayMR19 TaxID=2559608 RepID=UPI0032AF8038